MSDTKQVVKQLKDDIVLDIKVNKSYYLMVKQSLLTILTEIHDKSAGDTQEFIKNLVSKKYEELNPKERIFYTLTLLVGEIEKQASENDGLIEKEIDLKDYVKDSEPNKG